MPMAKELTEQQWHPWMRSAAEFARVNLTWFAVQFGSEEHRSWMAYFENLGWIPMAMRTLCEGQFATMPIQWPEWLPMDWDPLNKRGAKVYRIREPA